MAILADQNGVTCFVDQNGVTCFVDQNGNTLCCPQGSAGGIFAHHSQNTMVIRRNRNSCCQRYRDMKY